MSDTGEVLVGNDSYEGYCKDLADLIAKKLGISCKFIIANNCPRVKDIASFKKYINTLTHKNKMVIKYL